MMLSNSTFEPVYATDSLYPLTDTLAMFFEMIANAALSVPV